ncbi:hypothetical protein, partial [Microcoleus anatoxicus]
NVDFNPPANNNQNVDFNPPANNNQNVDFNPPANNNQNVDFNPPVNNNQNVDFNPPVNNNQNVDFNPPANNNQNVDFNPPQSNSINLNGYTIDGKFYQEFLKTGGLNGWLGAPKSGEESLGGNIVQYFEHGHIYWNGSKAIAYQEGTPVPKTPLNISSQLGVTKPSSSENNGGLNADQSSSASTTLRFQLDNASLWGNQLPGIDFDTQFTVKPQTEESDIFGMKFAAEASFDAKIYGFLSAGTVDIGLSGDFQVKTTTDGMTGKTTLSVNTANLNPDAPYMSTYLGFGAGLGVNTGVKATLKNIPFQEDISGEISNQFNLTAEQLIAKLLAPGASEFAEVDLGFNLNTNLWKKGNEMEADDTAGVKLDINKLGEIPDFFKVGVDLGVKQTSKAKVFGFWFDPDNIDGNPGDFYVPLGQSGGIESPLNFIPQALRVRPDIIIETNFAALAKGSVSVGVGDAIKKTLGNKMPDGILGNVLGNLPLDMGLSRETGIPISSISTKPFTNSGYWNSISLVSGNTPSGSSYGYNT